MTMLHRVQTRRIDSIVGPPQFFVASSCFPQTIDVLRTRAEPLGIELVVGDLARMGPTDRIFGALVQTPDEAGLVHDLRDFIASARRADIAVAVATDLLSLTLLTPPGELGADVVLGSSQRFGVPMGYGGPHAAFFATVEKHVRQAPGRIIGVSVDADGNRAYRLALQTREQHIRREKATSNICTAQVLLAIVASMYAVHHGPEGLRTIATRAHRMAAVLAAGLTTGGFDLAHEHFFDTITVKTPHRADEIVGNARDRGINIRRVDADHVAVACDEATTREHLRLLWASFGIGGDVEALDAATPDAYPTTLARATDYLTHPVFATHRSETSLLRYLRALSDKDVALDRSMIPLGSCTMKLNATAEMEPITWPEF